MGIAVQGHSDAEGRQRFDDSGCSCTQSSDPLRHRPAVKANTLCLRTPSTPAASDDIRPTPFQQAAIIGKLTTHVLDTANGCPASGMTVTLVRIGPEDEVLSSVSLNADGRANAPLLEGDALIAGRYRLTFDVASYFLAKGATLSDPPFLDRVPIEFAIADTGSHYHVPLLVSPWAYSTYRGS